MSYPTLSKNICPQLVNPFISSGDTEFKINSLSESPDKISFAGSEIPSAALRYNLVAFSAYPDLALPPGPS